MKTIKLHEEEYVTLATGIELNEIPEYVKKDSLARQESRGWKSDTWSWRKRHDQGVKRFTGTASKAESYRLINRDYHLFTLGQEQVKQKRSSFPLLSEIAEVYAGAPFSHIKTVNVTRLNNLRSLCKMTRHMAKGPMPKFAKIEGDAVRVKVVDPGFLTKVRADQLTEKSALDFQGIYCDNLNPNSVAYQSKAYGANCYLKMAKAVFSKKARKFYKGFFKLPDVTEWMEVEKLDVYKASYEAPTPDFIDKLWEDLPQLEQDDPDAYTLLLCSYGAGLTASETLNAKYSWFGSEEVQDVDRSRRTNWFIHVQPTDDWKPKNPKRIRKASVTESVFQKLIDLRYVARQEPNKNRVTLSDEELIKAVWSKSMAKVAKELGVSDNCIKKTCVNRGIPTPPHGFWVKVQHRVVANPHGTMPAEYAAQYTPQEETAKVAYTHNDYLIQRGRCAGKTGVASRLARWFKERGWERRMVAHEMRKLHLSTYLLLTGDLLATSKQAGHATTEMTEKTYVAVLKKHEAKIELPGT